MATDHTWRGGIPVTTAPGRKRTPVDLRRGACAVCRQNIYQEQETVAAPRPLLGKAHEWCVDKIDHDGGGEEG